MGKKAPGKLLDDDEASPLQMKRSSSLKVQTKSKVIVKPNNPLKMTKQKSIDSSKLDSKSLFNNEPFTPLTRK
jgi:hypothetical protein